MIKLNNVSHQIDNKTILNNISLSLPSEQVVALIGPNGAGKSTLFSVMSRLQTIQQGSVSFGEFDISQTDSKTMAKTVAILAQSNQLQGRLRVEELLMFGRYPYHQGRPTIKDYEKVAEVIEKFELQDLAHRYLSTLSGGQQQRVLIAMIVCQDTPYLLLDEPLNNLDMYHSGQLMRALRRLAHEQKKTIVIVLHDINQAAQFADTVVMMKSGEVVKTGHPIDVLTQETIETLYGVKATVIEHKGYPVIIDSRI